MSEPIDDPLDPMPPEPAVPPDERFLLSQTDLMAVLAMAFEQGYATGHAKLKLRDPKEEVTAMAYNCAAVIVHTKPWESTAVEDAIEATFSKPRIVIPR